MEAQRGIIFLAFFQLRSFSSDIIYLDNTACPAPAFPCGPVPPNLLTSTGTPPKRLPPAISHGQPQLGLTGAPQVILALEREGQRSLPAHPQQLQKGFKPATPGAAPLTITPAAVAVGPLSLPLWGSYPLTSTPVVVAAGHCSQPAQRPVPPPSHPQQLQLNYNRRPQETP